MNYKEFSRKLKRFFSQKQIRNLAKEAFESAQCAIAEPGELVLWGSEKHCEGMDFICNILWDISSDENAIEEIQSMCGGSFNEDSFRALEEQMDLNW